MAGTSVRATVAAATRVNDGADGALKDFAQCLATVVHNSGAVAHGDDRYYRYPGVSTISHMMNAYGIYPEIAEECSRGIRDEFALRYRELQDENLTSD